MGRANQTQFENEIKTKEIAVGTVTSGGIAAFTIDNNKAVDIISIKLLSCAALSASDTNYYTFVFTNKGTDASGSTSVGSLANTVSGGAITAYVLKAVTLSATSTDLHVLPAEVIQILFVKANSPSDITDCKFIVEYSEAY